MPHRGTDAGRATTWGPPCGSKRSKISSLRGSGRRVAQPRVREARARAAAGVGLGEEDRLELVDQAVLDAEALGDQHRRPRAEGVDLEVVDRDRLADVVVVALDEPADVRDAGDHLERRRLERGADLGRAVAGARPLLRAMAV